jgi:chromosome segregation ATPase
MMHRPKSPVHRPVIGSKLHRGQPAHLSERASTSVTSFISEDLSTLTAQTFDDTSNATTATNATLVALNQRTRAAEQQLRAAEQQVKGLKQRNAGQEEKLAKLRVLYVHKKKIIAALEEERDELKNQLDKQARIKKQNGATSTASINAQTQSKRYNDLVQLYNQLQASKEDLNKDFNVLQTENEELLGRLQELERQNRDRKVTKATNAEAGLPKSASYDQMEEVPNLPGEEDEDDTEIGVRAKPHFLE